MKLQIQISKNCNVVTGMVNLEMNPGSADESEQEWHRLATQYCEKKLESH
jgi:hypothetical protein